MPVLNWRPPRREGPADLCRGDVGEVGENAAVRREDDEGFQPPVVWGTEEHVRELFEGSGVELQFERTAVEFVFDSAEAVLEEYSVKLGPLVAAKAALEPEGKWEPLANELLALYEEGNTSDQGDLRFPGEYLVTTGTKS